MFGGLSFCCVWESLVRVWRNVFVLCVGQILWDCGSECVLCVGQFGACLEIVSVFCVWDSLERVWWIDFELCVGEIGAGLGQ